MKSRKAENQYHAGKYFPIYNDAFVPTPLCDNKKLAMFSPKHRELFRKRRHLFGNA